MLYETWEGRHSRCWYLKILFLKNTHGFKNVRKQQMEHARSLLAFRNLFQFWRFNVNVSRCFRDLASQPAGNNVLPLVRNPQVEKRYIIPEVLRLPCPRPKIINHIDAATWMLPYMRTYNWILSLRRIAGVWILCADVSEHFLFHLNRPCEQGLFTRPMKIGQCSETSAHKIQTPGSHPKERTQHSQDSESLKSRMYL